MDDKRTAVDQADPKAITQPNKYIATLRHHSKFIIGALAAVYTSIQPFTIEHSIAAGIGALLVYLVPNMPKDE